MRSILLVILIGWSAVACQAQMPATVSADTIPAWLSEKIARFEAENPDVNGKVEAYTYQQQTVYLVDFCVGCPDHLVYLYNKKGEEMCRFGGIAGTNSCPGFAREAVLIATVWSK